MTTEAKSYDDVDDFREDGDIEDVDYAGEVEAHVPYKTLSKGAVFSLLLSLLSIPTVALFVFADEVFWVSTIVPITAIVLGVVSLVRIRRNPIELTGLIPAVLGIMIGLPTIAGGSAMQAYIYMTEVPEGYERISWYELRPQSCPSRFDLRLRRGKARRQEGVR